MRPSPGSRRSMTSPSEIWSYLHCSFALMVKLMAKKLVGKPAATSPKPERWIGDVENLFAVGQRVPAILQLFRIVVLRHRFQVGVSKVHAFNFLLGQMAGTIGDAEPVFTGTVNEMRGRA